MKRIVAFTKYTYEGPSSRYRYYNYVDCFKNHGIDMVITPLFKAEYFSTTNKISKLLHVLWAYSDRMILLCSLLMKQKKYDLFIIEYELFPFMPPLFERLLGWRGIRYVVDYDDAIFHKYDMHQNRAIRRLLGRKIACVMALAERVVVCNAYLEEYTRRFNHKILRLPTVVLLDKYKEAEKKHIRQPDQPFTIGWIGSKSTSVYLLDILPAIEKFASQYDVQFNFVGFDGSVLPDSMKERCKIKTVAWSEETEIDEILNFDTGIMPLRNDPWSQGKCGFKLVQYMSCKKPVIASPVGINADLVENGVNGFLAETAEEWFHAFEKLYSDSEVRKKMAENNWKKIELNYNHTKNCEQYAKLIFDIVGKRKEID